MSNSKPSKAKVKVKVATKVKPATPEAEVVESVEAPVVEPEATEPPKKPLKIKLAVEAGVVSKETEATAEPEVADESPEAEPEPAAEPVDEPVADLPVAPIEPAPPQRTFAPVNRQRIGKLRSDIGPAFAPQPVAVSKEATNLKFWIWAGITAALGAGLIASAWPAVHSFASTQASNLVRMGEQAGGDEAMLDYRLASHLDPTNTAAATQAASAQLAGGQPTYALATLQRAMKNRAGGGLDANFEAALVRAELETGDKSGAALDAATLAQTAGATQDQLVTAALALAAAGKGSDAAALEPRLSSVQALQRVQRAAAGKVSLASELAASGLLRSSSAILKALPSSPPRDLLLARIQATSAAKADLDQAATNYLAYLREVPADVAARLAYADVLSDLKETDAASHQRSLAASLSAGQP